MRSSGPKGGSAANGLNGGGVTRAGLDFQAEPAQPLCQLACARILWIDSTLYSLYARFKDRWANYNNFFAGFRVTGARRLAVEFLSEAATLGTGGLAIVLMFELPAIELTKNPNWRTGSEFSVTFLDRYGNDIGKRGIQFSDAVPLEEIPDTLIKATMATEDRRFFDHFGIDVLGTMRAMVQNARANEVVQGGSSISQQLAKNLFLSSERSMQRKIREVYLALWLESHLTKKEILKLYLDRAYLGGGNFGVEAASQFYFGKSVRDINLAESAILAGLFKAPSKYAPHSNPAESRARTNQVLSNLVEAGFMTEGQVHAARLNPAKIIDHEEDYAPNYFLDWAYEEVQRLMRGKGEYVLTARTTVDVPLQKAAEQSIETAFETDAKYARASQAVLVSMDTDGAVRAMVGGRDYGDSQFNRAVHGARQPGSSFKPYVYLTAIENGIRPKKVVSDTAPTCGNWSPVNYGGGVSGRSMTLYDALKMSVNTIAVKLSLDVGREKVLEVAHRIGLTSVRKTCSMALGDTGIAPLDHMGGYAVFANGGKAVKPYAILELRNTRDEVVYCRERDEPPPAADFQAGGYRNPQYHAPKSRRGGNRPRREARFHERLRQDRHDLGPEGRLVHGLHRPIRDRRLVRQRRLQRHGQRHDWRPYGRAGLAPIHGGGPYQHGYSANSGPSAASAPDRGAAAPCRNPPRRSRRQFHLGSGTTDPTKRLPARTRKMLTSLSKLLKDAPKLKPSDGGPEKGASLDKLPVRTQ